VKTNTRLAILTGIIVSIIVGSFYRNHIGTNTNLPSVFQNRYEMTFSDGHKTIMTESERQAYWKKYEEDRQKTLNDIHQAARQAQEAIDSLKTNKKSDDGK
jgi:hypothetical protein